MLPDLIVFTPLGSNDTTSDSESLDSHLLPVECSPEYNPNSTVTDSAVREWDLVCERETLRASISGELLFYLSDIVKHYQNSIAT